MSGQHHLIQLMQDYSQALGLLGLEPEKVHWQSFLVLAANCPQDMNLIRSKLIDADSGWFRDGMRNHGDGTSLYLSPKGMPFWVGYGQHATLYMDLLDASSVMLDNSGWLHISGGRVDVHARMTDAQKRWLAENKPHPRSYNGIRDGDHCVDWRLNDPDRRGDRAPTPYSIGEQFDVRPVPDGDWGRLMDRILRAQEAAKAIEAGAAPAKPVLPEAPSFVQYNGDEPPTVNYDKAAAFAMAYGQGIIQPPGRYRIDPGV